MITAMQSAKFEVATSVLEARKKLGACISYVCVTKETADELLAIMSKLDAIFTTIITNEPMQGERK